MNAGNVLYCLATIVALAGALITVTSRNPIRGAIGLLATIFGIALLFLKLNAQFLAAIQVIVYAGAVVVLFVFVIMLLGPDAAGEVGSFSRGKAKVARAIGGGLLGILSAVALVLLAGKGTDHVRFGHVQPDHGTVEAVGGLLFSDGLVAFELATALLIVAVVGAIAVARGKQTSSHLTPAERGTGKFFQGVVVARDDRGRPPKKVDSK